MTCIDLVCCISVHQPRTRSETRASKVPKSIHLVSGIWHPASYHDRTVSAREQSHPHIELQESSICL